MKTNKTTEQAARHDAGGVLQTFQNSLSNYLPLARAYRITNKNLSPGLPAPPVRRWFECILEGMLRMLCLFTWWIDRIAIGTLYGIRWTFLAMECFCSFVFSKVSPFKLAYVFLYIPMDRCVHLFRNIWKVPDSGAILKATQRECQRSG